MDNEKLLNKLSDIENVLKIGFRMVFYIAQAFFVKDISYERSKQYLIAADDQYSLIREE